MIILLIIIMIILIIIINNIIIIIIITMYLIRSVAVSDHDRTGVTLRDTMTDR